MAKLSKADAATVEIVCADFNEARRRRAPAQGSLFGSAA